MEQWTVTVLRGKDSLVVALSPPTSDPKWLHTLQETLAQKTGIAVAHQKLLYRGKQLTSTNVLANGAKLMLLKNANFHKSEASQKKTDAPTEEKEEKEAEAPRAAAAVPASQRLDIDPQDIDEDHVLVQAARGKAVFEFLFLSTATIASVKVRVGGALGLPGAALRLVLKGKTPKDDDVVGSFIKGDGAPRVLKCMVLLQAKQHDLLEREDDFRRLQNELTKVETDVARLANVMTRNLLSRDEVGLRLHAVQDHVGQLQSNLEILVDQLKATKLVQGSSTLAALENAKREGAILKTRVDALAQQFHSRQ